MAMVLSCCALTAAARVPKVGRCDVVLAVRLDQRECSEALDDLCPCLRPAETLEQFLQDQAGRDDDVRTGKGVLQCRDFRFGGRGVAP